MNIPDSNINMGLLKDVVGNSSIKLKRITLMVGSEVAQNGRLLVYAKNVAWTQYPFVIPGGTLCVVSWDIDEFIEPLIWCSTGGVFMAPIVALAGISCQNGAGYQWAFDFEVVD